jgi:hypothetical protein
MFSRRVGGGLPALAGLKRLPLSEDEEGLSASEPEIQAAWPGLVETRFLVMAGGLTGRGYLGSLKSCYM